MDDSVLTAEQLEQMTASERRAAFEASIVVDLDQAPADMVARAREKVERRIAASEAQSR